MAGLRPMIPWNDAPVVPAIRAQLPSPKVFLGHRRRPARRAGARRAGRWALRRQQPPAARLCHDHAGSFIAAGDRPGQCPLFETPTSRSWSRIPATAPASPALHVCNGLLEIPDRVRHRGGLLRVPAVELEPLRGEDPEHLAALTEQLAALLAYPHP